MIRPISSRRCFSVSSGFCCCDMHCGDRNVNLFLLYPTDFSCGSCLLAGCCIFLCQGYDETCAKCGPRKTASVALAASMHFMQTTKIVFGHLAQRFWHQGPLQESFFAACLLLGSAFGQWQRRSERHGPDGIGRKAVEDGDNARFEWHFRNIIIYHPVRNRGA